MFDLQHFIQRLEGATATRIFRIAAFAMAVVLLVLLYDWRAYKNFSTLEAMDTAQVARNLATGQGYSTLFVRPLSIYLLQQRALATQGQPPTGQSADTARLKGPHPDLANPPVYPVVLAGLMKVLPFYYTVDTESPFWSAPPVRVGGGRIFWRYEPDFLIALFNQALFLGTIVLVFFLARRLFDWGVAWLSALVLLGTELLWRFSTSGLSTMLLLLIFTGLLWVLTLLEEELRAPKRRPQAVFWLAALAGVLVGVGALTRYAFLWLILPVVFFIVLFGGQRRALLGLIACLSFGAVLTPWIVRNYAVSGVPFGTASFTLREHAHTVPDHKLQRSLEPDFAGSVLPNCWYKLSVNSRQLVQDELPKFGGTWLSAFFLVGLMVGFRNPAVQRLRYFLLSCFVVLFVAQALGRTQLSEDSPTINSENLLVLLVPLVLVYGVSLFFLLLEQIRFPYPEARFLVIGLFMLVAWLPMLLTLWNKTAPLAYPPYHPPTIQDIASWTKPTELTMSDTPWAVAWYGQRQSVWLTLDADLGSESDLLAINDYQKPISILYLTARTLDSKFLSQCLLGGESSWGFFVAHLPVHELPAGFPLRKSPKGYFPRELILADWERWLKPVATAAP